MIDLRAITDKVLADFTGIRQTKDLAEEVLAQVPDADLRDALRLALPGFIRHRIGMNSSIPSGDIKTDTVTTNPYLDKPRKAGQRNAARSAASKMIREWWLDQIEVNVAGGGYLHLGECTFDDLMFAATKRREAADDYMRAAERFETIADAVKEHGVDTVADLPAKARAELTPLFER